MNKDKQTISKQIIVQIINTLIWAIIIIWISKELDGTNYHNDVLNILIFGATTNLLLSWSIKLSKVKK
ncbi:hypothetical protein [Flavivirga sp. 57AJ16]|uniref:hypothetical protein n=1 Tax=Flavivirga sp. 57AJ16 TaxID=3025307 RepID=UPI0023661D40|nr:hypothetical protein [Flavivirga sp. 57AJ16]MDD7886191.1 hypothetical protein [Flavivirga sp. 57AJ16]